MIIFFFVFLRFIIPILGVKKNLTKFSGLNKRINFKDKINKPAETSPKTVLITRAVFFKIHFIEKLSYV